MQFCTVINCMDGRIQIPVIEYLQKRFDVEYVDSITEPGPNLILSEQKNTALIQSIHERLKISVEKHGSVGIAVVGHHDCAGNPALEEEQKEHARQAAELLRQKYTALEIIALWVDQDWNVSEVTECGLVD